MYQVSVVPLDQRSDRIRELSEESKTISEVYDVYPGRAEPLKVIMLSVDLPVYRMANGRTQTAQLQYISQHDLDEAFFQSGEENRTAQQAQHVILSQLAQEERANSITAIYKELRDRGQTEAILITPQGQVLNGNRRLAAMRDLTQENSSLAEKFRSVRCVVLPSLTPIELDEIEVRLQMTPETKLPYGWVNEALKVRSLLKTHDEQATAALMRRRMRTIKETMQALNYAEIYLRDWSNAPNDYQRVEGGQQFFKDLVGSMANKPPYLTAANLKLAWIIFDAPRKKGRIYNLNTVLGESAEEVLLKLNERLVPEPERLAEKGPSPGDFDLLIDFGDDAEMDRPSFVGLCDVFDDPDLRDEVSDEVWSVATGLLERKSTLAAGKEALRKVQEAQSLLLGVDMTQADMGTYGAIRDNVHKMRTQLDRIEAAASVEPSVAQQGE